MTRAKLYCDGAEIGCCDLELPATLTNEWECAPKFSGSFSTTFRIASGKKARRMWQNLRDLPLSDLSAAFLRRYRRVKHHQQRKRLIRKRLHAK